MAGAVAYGWFERTILATLPEDLAGYRDWRPPTVVTVLADDGTPIDEFYVERRIWVDLDELPDHVWQAFVAAEDRRFFEHEGVDPAGVARALVVNFQTGTTRQGGSTLTQQLVKNLLVGKERSYIRKIKEAVLAYRLEKELGKEGVLQLYLNYIALGSGNYGVEAAARDYFGVSARDLDPGQAALLAGLVPAPSRYSPRADPELATERRRLALRSMVEAGYLADDVAAEFLDDPIAPPPRGFGHRPAAAYATLVRREIRRLFGDEAPFILGLRVHTPVDLRVQAVAEQAVRDAVQAHFERQGPRDGDPDGGPWAQAAAVVIENRTGRVIAVVGGTEDTLEGFVRATQARRQPGSSFKPYVYAAALRDGQTQIDTVVDAPISLPGGNGRAWSPKNYGGGYAGAMPMRSAMARSLNTVAVRLVMASGPEAVAEIAHGMGVRTPLRTDLTMALGSSEVTPFDQALGYAAFARAGVPVDPVFMDRLEDPLGEILALSGGNLEVNDHDVPIPGGALPRALPAGVAYEASDMLRAVVRNGTARRAFVEGTDRAGKTGTTNDFVDAWFVGFTPRHTVAVWVGTDGWRSLGDSETGGKAALPAWMAIVEALGETPGEIRAAPPESVWVPHQGEWVALVRGASGAEPDPTVPLPAF